MQKLGIIKQVIKSEKWDVVVGLDGLVEHTA